ncbi:hypothetical protein OPT61_g4478 [Boeremia exigua]|uniref:Uncharacterized protein n=1 Tax=Boeremia exigua TaxID=749465 RepID=A0ACC2IDZ3_9PLEO|nr:hypothetical protein OPT61_g4478 [Boeremia exigua]
MYSQLSAVNPGAARSMGTVSVAGQVSSFRWGKAFSCQAVLHVTQRHPDTREMAEALGGSPQRQSSTLHSVAAQLPLLADMLSNHATAACWHSLSEGQAMMTDKATFTI